MDVDEHGAAGGSSRDRPAEVHARRWRPRFGVVERPSEAGSEVLGGAGSEVLGGVGSEVLGGVGSEVLGGVGHRASGRGGSALRS